MNGICNGCGEDRDLEPESGLCQDCYYEEEYGENELGYDSPEELLEDHRGD